MRSAELGMRSGHVARLSFRNPHSAFRIRQGVFGLNLHEYQARQLLKAAGIPVPDGDVASTPAEVEAIARRLGSGVVVKAQVHAGGRGKAGGVKLAADPADAKAKATQILGMTIKGLVVEKVLVAPAAQIASESYAGIIVDRVSQRPVVMVSPAGGVDIEEVAGLTMTTGRWLTRSTM